MKDSKNSITVVINAYNEERNIEGCIKSAHLLTDDVVVIDTSSIDRTADIAKRLGVVVYRQPYSRYVEVSRKYSIGKAKGEWVLLLDADERLTIDVASEIKKTLQKTKHTHFKISRKNFFAGKWLRHGGWYPDHVIKLINKSSFIDWPPRIHTAPNMRGECGLIKNSIIHLSQPNLEHMVSRTIVYEDEESKLLFEATRAANTSVYFRKFFGELYRRLFKGMGFFDGTYGIIESIYQAFSKTITYIFLYEKNQKSSTIRPLS